MITEIISVEVRHWHDLTLIVMIELELKNYTRNESTVLVVFEAKLSKTYGKSQVRLEHDICRKSSWSLLFIQSF